MNRSDRPPGDPLAEFKRELGALAHESLGVGDRDPRGASVATMLRSSVQLLQRGLQQLDALLATLDDHNDASSQRAGAQHVVGLANASYEVMIEQEDTSDGNRS